MDPETKKMLEENLRLSKENNDILQKMVRIHRWTQIYRVIYWVLILGASFGAYYFIQPYLDSLLNYYGNISGSVSDIKKVGSSIPDLSHVKDILNQIQN